MDSNYKIIMEMLKRVIKKILVLYMVIMLTITVYPQKEIVLNDLSPEELLKYSKEDPETGLKAPFPIPAPNEVLERYVERPVQQIIFVPLEVEEGPQFVVPSEIFRIKVTIRNKGDFPLYLAIVEEVKKPLWEVIWEKIVSGFKALLGRSPETTAEKIYRIIPTYYLVAALDPSSVEIYGAQYRIIYPGGSVEIEPGYGCYDIILGNELQMAEILRRLKEGELTYDDIFCGKIKTFERLQAVLGAESKFVEALLGPITIVPPTIPYREDEIVELEKLKVVYDKEKDQVVAIYGGCSDKGDGRRYIYEMGDTIIRVESRPRDCILNPGETAEFYVYGWVNPLPAFMISPQAVPEVLSKIYMGTEEEIEALREKYPAVHEILFMIGRVNDVQLGVTREDVLNTIGDILLTPFRPILWLFGLDKIYDYPAISKLWACIVSGRCIYEVLSVYTFKTYLIVAAPEFEVTLTLQHIGFVVASILLGSYLGYRYGARKV